MDAYLAGVLTLIESNQPKVMLGIEATGLLTPLHRFPLPWEIGACKRYQDGGIIPFTAILDWGFPLTPEANPRHLDPRLPQLTGQDPELVLLDFGHFLDDAILIGYRIDSFTVPVLLAAYERLALAAPRLLWVPGHTIDIRTMGTLVLAANGFLDQGESAGRGDFLSLTELADRFGISYDLTTMHGAMADVDLAGQVFWTMVHQARTAL